MRVVEVVRGLGLGGAETLLYQRLKYSIETGIITPAQTTVINTFPSQSYFADKIRGLGVCVQSSRSDRRILSSLGLWRSMARLRADNIVVVHSPFPAAAIKARAALRKQPFPIIEVSHNTDYARPTLLLGRLLNHHADLCIAVSDDVGAAETTSGFPRKSVILAGADRTAMRAWVKGASGTAESMRESLGVVGDGRLIVAVGSLAERKGHRHLISALAQLDDPQVHVAIVGTGELRSALEHQIQAAGLKDRAHLLGRQDDGWRWTAVADALAHPSYHEGLPVTLMEAAALGVPMVASDVGGAGQVCAGSKRSRLVPPGSSTELAGALREVLDQVDPFSEVFAGRGEDETHWDMSRYCVEFYDALAVERDRALRSMGTT